jgi:hypothetical protein
MKQFVLVKQNFITLRMVNSMAWKRGWKMVSRNPKRFKRVWLRVPDAVKPIRKYGPNGTVGPAVRFTWSETQSGDGEMPKGVIKTNVVHQARLLNVLRKNIAKHYKVSFADVSINVNSWYRSPSYNKKIGGAQFSQHMLGKATDITVTVQGRRLSPQKVAELAESVAEFRAGGIGWYDTAHGNFTHLDFRESGQARWVNG